jgi:dimethylglycine oxidase
MESRARLVVIGAGIVGTAAVYHLTRFGWRDIVVIEQGPLHDTGGSSGHAPGLVFQTNASRTMTELAKETVKLYGDLELDGQPCFYPVGSLEVACTRERLEDLKRRLGYARSWGLPAELLTPRETRARIPLLDEARIRGAYCVPGDGLARAVRAAEAMTREAQQRGARFHARTRVTGIEVVNGRVRAVVTSRGRIETEQLLVCCGIWGPLVGRMAGVSIPLMPMQHIYARTAPIPALAGETREIVHPVLRHQDRSMYFRQHADCYGIGSYRHEPLLVEATEILSHEAAPVAPAQVAFTPEHFAAAHAAAVELLPALRGAEVAHAFNGMFSFTPDGFPLLGEAIDVRGFWVAEAIWITHAGGAARAVAELMHEGVAWVDLRECAIDRFHAHAHTRAYLRARGAQQYREVYDIIHPRQPIEHPRGLRRSPFHTRLEEQGALFFESAGWEVPQWFHANEKLLAGRAWPERSGWESRYWSPIEGAEHIATRERVGLFDLTRFVKIEVAGAGALALLEHLCANRIDGRVGKVVYTSMLNTRGGIVCDLTVTRLAGDRFLVLTGAASGMQDLAWIRHHAASRDGVTVTDITSAYCGVGLWGPMAGHVLREVSDDDVSTFDYFTARRLAVGSIPALALRVSYVGEPGWEIYCATEYGAGLWDALWKAGQPFGMVAGGSGAFDSLRLEKGYRLWGADLHTDYNPYEAGLGFAVKLDKGDFIGREALTRVKQRGLTRRLCCLTFDDPGAVVVGKEPVLDGDTPLGYVTSANYGYTVGRAIAYAYLPIDHATVGSKAEVQYFDRRYRATVTDEPLYDPKGLRLRRSSARSPSTRPGP